MWVCGTATVVEFDSFNKAHPSHVPGANRSVYLIDYGKR